MGGGVGKRCCLCGGPGSSAGRRSGCGAFITADYRGGAYSARDKDEAGRGLGRGERPTTCA